jgi:uncharacterized membrane protein YdjX (TVP38/TMEM64 family)
VDDSTGGAAGHAGRRRLLWTGILLLGLLLIGATTYICLSNTPMLAEYRKLASFYSSKRALREYLKSFGAYAPLAFVAIQVLQVVVAPIPGELTGVLGGYLFGTWLGFAYSTVGLTVGSILAFLLARWLGLPVVRRVVSDEVYRKFDFVSRAGGELVTLVCFLIPGFPKDYLCFLLGISRLPWGTFLVLSTFGRMPGTWLLSIQGAKVRDAQYRDMLLYLLVAAVAVAVAYIYRERVYQWMHRRNKAETPGRGDV